MVDGFVMRYDTNVTKDGLRGNEGAFLACSFWLADNLVLLGRHEDRANFLNGCFRSATTSACSLKNATPTPNVSLVIFPKHSPTLL